MLAVMKPPEHPRWVTLKMPDGRRAKVTTKTDGDQRMVIVRYLTPKE